MTTTAAANANKGTTAAKAGATAHKPTARQAKLAEKEKKEKEQAAARQKLLQEAQEKLEKARKDKEEEKRKKEEQEKEAKRQQEEEEAMKRQQEEAAKQRQSGSATAGNGGNNDATMGGTEETEEEKKRREEEEARVRREEEKKLRAAERAREEEAAKARADAQAREGSTGGDDPDDVPNPDVNDFLNNLNRAAEEDGLGDDDGEQTEYTETDRDEGRSPPKNRRKKTKGRKARKSKRKEKEAADKAEAKAKRQAEKKAQKEKEKAAKEAEETNKGRDPEAAGGDEWKTDDEGEGEKSSSLRSGRYANAGSTPGRKAKVGITLMDRNHDHKYKGVFIEGSWRLINEDDRHTEFSMNLRTFYTEILKVDPHVHILPAEAGAKEPVLMQPSDISLNHTDLGANITVPGNASFQKRKPWDMEWADVTDDDLEAPVVKFSFSFSCDMHPSDLVRRVRPEFERNGGVKLSLKRLATHTPKDALVMWRMYKEVGERAVLAELQRMLEKARDLKDDTSMEIYEWAGKPIPTATIRVAVPHIPNQDTSYVSKMPKKLKHQRNTIHIVVDKKYVKQMQDLMEVAKEEGMVQKMWGPQVHPSNVIISKEDPFGDEEKTPSHEVSNMAKFTQKQVNYNYCMTTTGLIGIVQLDEEVAIYATREEGTIPEISGFIALRQVLYTAIKSEKGSSVISELHNEQPLATVEAVHNNSKEAEDVLVNMNENIWAYLHHLLPGMGHPLEFVERLLATSCDQQLKHTANEYLWDAEKKRLIIPESKLSKANEIEKEDWHVDVFGDFMSTLEGGDKKKGGKKSFIAPESLFDIDDEGSVHTIRQKPGDKPKATNSGYGGSPGAPTFQVGGDKKQKGEEDVETVEINSDDEDSKDATATASDDLENLSREELIAQQKALLEQLKKAKLSSKPTGSAPDSGDGWDHSDSSDEGENMSEDGSSSESSSGSSADLSEEGSNRSPSG